MCNTGTEIVDLAGNFRMLSHFLEEFDRTDALAVVPGSDHHHAVEFLSYLDYDLVA